jgi:hypothetical protein
MEEGKPSVRFFGPIILRHPIPPGGSFVFFKSDQPQAQSGGAATVSLCFFGPSHHRQAPLHQSARFVFFKSGQPQAASRGTARSRFVFSSPTLRRGKHRAPTSRPRSSGARISIYPGETKKKLTTRLSSRLLQSDVIGKRAPIAGVSGERTGRRARVKGPPGGRQRNEKLGRNGRARRVRCPRVSPKIPANPIVRSVPRPVIRPIAAKVWRERHELHGRAGREGIIWRRFSVPARLKLKNPSTAGRRLGPKGPASMVFSFAIFASLRERKKDFSRAGPRCGLTDATSGRYHGCSSARQFCCLPRLNGLGVFSPSVNYAHL